MPIYAYKCSSCHHAQDILQKMSDPILTVCPECGKDTYVKQVTAAGFQLKGTGWYVTDFRDNNGGAASSASAPASGESSATSAPASAVATPAASPAASGTPST